MSRHDPGCSPCPICGKPRVPGSDHGRCMEVRAATEGKRIKKVFPSGKRITVEQDELARYSAATKRYIAGKLPGWMLD